MVESSMRTCTTRANASPGRDIKEARAVESRGESWAESGGLT